MGPVSSHLWSQQVAAASSPMWTRAASKSLMRQLFLVTSGSSFSRLVMWLAVCGPPSGPFIVSCTSPSRDDGLSVTLCRHGRFASAIQAPAWPDVGMTYQTDMNVRKSGNLPLCPSLYQHDIQCASPLILVHRLQG